MGAAISNAVADAIGDSSELCHLPLTPDVVLGVVNAPTSRQGDEDS
jgi:CO/xanthine dehydrogenase Mo-binding subunit